MASNVGDYLTRIGNKAVGLCVLLAALSVLAQRWEGGFDSPPSAAPRHGDEAPPRSAAAIGNGTVALAELVHNFNSDAARDPGITPLPPVDDGDAELIRRARMTRSVDRGPINLARYADVDQSDPTPAIVAEEPLTQDLPVGNRASPEQVSLTANSDLITLTAADAPLSTVLTLIAKQHGLNIVNGLNLDQSITVSLKDVRLPDALDAILSVNRLTWAMQNNILYITSIDGQEKVSAANQGRMLKTFCLNYVAAADVDRVVKGLLSPVGQSFTVETNPTDQRRTQERLIVEDLPAYLQRVEAYIANMDQPPRQVVVEANILQIKLNDSMKRGVNIEQLLRVANAQVTFQTQGFASATASPAGVLKIDGTDLDAVMDCLQTTTDAKTLASPKIAVLNGQEARIQIGGQIGYLTSTSTMTTTVQTVNFLNTGVILNVIPIITADRQVLLSVKPQVSKGSINPTTNLPQSDTTEVETRVMLADGEVVVIGGLISETDNEVENKLPILGNIKWIGALFRRRTVEHERSEVIITLRPRIVNEFPGCRDLYPAETAQGTTPLFQGPLIPVDRSAWEPRLPSATTQLYARPPQRNEVLVDVGPSPAQVPNGEMLPSDPVPMQQFGPPAAFPPAPIQPPPIVAPPSDSQTFPAPPTPMPPRAIEPTAPDRAPVDQSFR